MNFCAGFDSASLKKCRSRARHEIAGVGRQRWVIARELDAAVRSLKGEIVAQIDRLHHRFEFVKTIGALAENVQQQIDFAGRWLGERHDTKNAPTPKRCGRMRKQFNSV